MKVCQTCRQAKALESFYKTTQSYDGYAGVCRSCTRARTKRQGATTEKQCARCGQTKPLVDFHKNRRRSDGVSPYCVPCTHLYANTYYAAKSHDTIVSKAYGLERGQYAELLEAQGGVCAICGRPESVKLGQVVKRLAIDHDHTTAVVRGLLCLNCNRGLGDFADDPKRLRAAADYLERHRS